MDKQANHIQIIHDVYPDFKIETLHINQNGQFNDILVINEEAIFRFPKTLREADKLVTESSLLWSLRGRTTLPIPRPIYRSKVAEPIGHVFMGYHMLPVGSTQLLCQRPQLMSWVKFIAHRIVSFSFRLT